MIAIITFFKTLVALGSFLGAGAAAALVGQIVGRWISPLVGVLCGAAIVGAMAFWVWSADNTKLKAQNRALKAKQAELVLTTAELRKTLREQIRAAESNAKVMADLRAKLAKMPRKPECDIDGSIVDELNKIQ